MKKFIFIILILLPICKLFSYVVPVNDIKLLKGDFFIFDKKIKVSHRAKEFINLKEYKRIKSNYKYFYPVSVTLDKNDNIFVYDKMLNKIVKFNGDLEYKKSFGTVGKGRGKYSPKIIGLKYIGYNDGKIYVSDPLFKKLLVYNTDGEFVDEFEYPKNIKYLFPTIIRDEDKNLNLTGINRGWNVLEIFNHNFEYKNHTKEYFYILKIIQGLYGDFIYYKLRYYNPYKKASFRNTRFIFLRNNLVMVYVFNDSKVYKFETDNYKSSRAYIRKKKDADPSNPDDYIVENIKYRDQECKDIYFGNLHYIPYAVFRNLKRRIEKEKGSVPEYLFNDFFIDIERKNFYLSGFGDIDAEKNIPLLYQFGLKDGKLIRVFKAKGRIYFKAVNKGYIYAIDKSSEEVVVYKHK